MVLMTSSGIEPPDRDLSHDLDVVEHRGRHLHCLGVVDHRLDHLGGTPALAMKVSMASACFPAWMSRGDRCRKGLVAGAAFGIVRAIGRLMQHQGYRSATRRTPHARQELHRRSGHRRSPNRRQLR